MDWSSNTPPITTSLPYVLPTGNYVSLPCVSLPQGIIHDNNVFGLSGSRQIILNYSNGQPSDPSLQDGACQALSLFESKESLSLDITNINTSLRIIIQHIKNHPVNKTALCEGF